MKVGIIGCGAITTQYLKQAALHPGIELVAVADLDLDRARAKAVEHGSARALSPGALLSDSEIELVINLTVPAAHHAVTLAALRSGKHVYSEKPFATTRSEARELLDAAQAAGLQTGCAPDTVLGTGLQAARCAIDVGEIGKPVAFTAFMMGPGHEGWHPNPAYFYERGGGPMLDMGPYYLAALINLLGPVRRIQGIATTAIPLRVITSEPRRGQKIEVHTPDHICGVVEFENGAAGAIVTSFATPHPVHDPVHPITIWGDEGALRVLDPNRFDGAVLVRRKDEMKWREFPVATPTGYGRAAGAAEMIQAIADGRPPRCSGYLGAAALDLMLGFTDSSDEGRAVHPSYPIQRPDPLDPLAPFGDFRLPASAIR